MTVNPPRPPMDPEVLAELLPLTQVIADTVHSTHLTLGPRGDEDLICALTVTVAAWAGRHILPSRARELVGQTSAAVPGPPATRAADPDRIAEALYAHNHPGWATRYTDLDQDERDTYLARANAVLAVLPPPADRAAVLREAIARVRRIPVQCTGLTGPVWFGQGWKDAISEFEEIAERMADEDERRMADEAQQQPDTGTPGCWCGHAEDRHWKDQSGRMTFPEGCHDCQGWNGAHGYAQELPWLPEGDEPAARARQDDPPVEPCPPGCVACATDESHDPAPAAGARQDGAQS